LLLFNSNSQLKKYLDQKQTIISLISKFNNSTQEFNLVSSTVISPRVVEDRSQFVTQINNVLNANQIKLSSVTVVEFETTTIGSNLNEADAKISFKDFSNNDLSNFLKGILKKEKMKAKKVLITKDKLSALLSGEITVNHYSTIKKTEI